MQKTKSYGRIPFSAPPPGEEPIPSVEQRLGFGLSHIGRKRKANQDAFLVDNELGLYVVADGMGGHAAGEVASQEAVEAVYSMVKRGLRDQRPLTDPLSEDDARSACRLVEAAVQGATYMVYSLAEQDRRKSGMGTTISALVVCGDYAVVGQVGDSRVYRIINDEAEQLTEDHTLIAWQLKQGLITPQEASVSPHRNVITRAVGSRDYVEVDTRIVGITKGDKFLLCSDGLHGYLRVEDIVPILALGREAAVQRFIDLANERGGRDNITAILVELE